jgi:L-lactate dehydrogenase complex protein LldG
MSEPSRDRILARVRLAGQIREPREHPGELADPMYDTGELIPRFERLFEESGGEVVRLADMKDARRWLTELARGFGSVAISPMVPPDLCPKLPDRMPAEADLGVSLAAGAVAETGTLVLDSREGRRLQLLPPTHLVWVGTSSITATLAEAVSRAAAESAGGLPAALGLHSGPSKSADIGMVTVKGVHGPGRVIAAILDAL